MKKIILLTVSFILLFCGCSANNSVNGNTAVNEATIFAKGGYSFTDCKNQKVILKDMPEKVISNDPALAELWKISGGRNITTANTNDNLKADFIILSADSKDCEPEPSSVYAFFEINSFRGYLYTLKIFTDINLQPSIYEYYGTELQKNIENIIEICNNYEKMTVCLLGKNGSEAESSNFVYSILNDIAIVSDKENAQILLVLPDGNADAEKNAIMLPEDLFLTVPNSRFAEAYNYIANILYNINGD